MTGASTCTDCGLTWVPPFGRLQVNECPVCQWKVEARRWKGCEARRQEEILHLDVLLVRCRDALETALPWGGGELSDDAKERIRGLLKALEDIPPKYPIETVVGGVHYPRCGWCGIKIEVPHECGLKPVQKTEGSQG